MTDSDDRVSRHYRSLAREEPPAALDARILAAAREAARPRARNRWMGPVSIAAVLVLGIGVTLRMQQEEPGIETSPASEYQAPPASEPAPPVARERRDGSPAAPAKPAAQPDLDLATPKRADASKGALGSRLAEEKPPARSATPKPQPRPDAPPAAEPVPAPAPAAAMSAPAPAAAAQPAPASPGAPAQALVPQRAKRAFADSPAKQESAAPRDEREVELERIARLRDDGKHAEADKALEEFRRRNSDYRIPDALWERVKPR